MNQRRTPIVIATLLIIATILGVLMRPTYRIADTRPPFDLDVIVPKQFGDWHVLPNQANQIVDPDVKSNLARTYNKLLTRSYINSHGQRVMLSIAYGKDQRGDLAVHYPEVCYSAQGFEVGSKKDDRLQLDNHLVPIRRLETKMNTRYEPVSYWTTIGDYVSLGGIEKRLIELDYGFKRQVPDGLLFRVSSIDTDNQAAFSLQDGFIKDLVSVLTPSQKSLLLGSTPLRQNS